MEVPAPGCVSEKDVAMCGAVRKDQVLLGWPQASQSTLEVWRSFDEIVQAGDKEVLTAVFQDDALIHEQVDVMEGIGPL